MISNPEPTGSKNTKARPLFEASDDFKNMLDLLGVYSEASNQLDELQASVNSDVLELMDEHKKDYAKYQQALTEAETALEVIARKHPDWFVQKKSIRTPFGTPKLTKSTHLEIVNEEATVKLLRAEASRSRAANAANAAQEIFDADQYIRTKEEPNLEALEGMDDATLTRFMVRRVTEEKFSVTPAKLDMGKAVAEAAKKNN